MARLSKAQILAAEDRPTVDVEVPEWGGEVRLRGLTLGDMIRFQEKRKSATNAEALVYLLAYSAVDDRGDRLFEESDAEALAGKSPEVIDRLGDEIIRLNRMGKSDDEDRAKNS